MTTRILISALCLLFAASVTAADNKPIPMNPQIKFTTSQGEIVVKLNSRRAPLTVANFVNYTRAGHYNGTIFHRVIASFMIQGGGHDADLTEKPTKTSVPNESGNGLSNQRGTIAMARTGNPHSASAQFFINLVDNSRLDPSPARWGYTVFGQVTSGMDVVDKIAALETGPAGRMPSDVPKTTVLIEKAELIDAKKQQ